MVLQHSQWHVIMSKFCYIIVCCVFASNFVCGGSPNGGDEFLNSYQLIEKYGYQPQKHSVVTEDGYIVNLFRIVRTGPPVLLVHGIADSSDSWLVLGPKDSLAYILAEFGFDVWLFNSRGNKYSKNHVKDFTGKKYWDFSFEEMGRQDLATSIDYILAYRRYAKLTYVGFSQGTTLFLILGSFRPDYNEKIKQAVLLAPVAWIDNIKYPFINIYAKNVQKLESISALLGLYEVYSENLFKNAFHATSCKSYPLRLLCDLEYFVNYGINTTSNIDPDKFSVIGSHIPSGTSMKTFLHYLQLYRSGRFQRYNYGSATNKRVYKKAQPPEYKVSRITAPVTIFASEDDWFSDIRDVEKLISKMPNVVRLKMLNKSLSFTHIEYVYGSRAKHLINDELVSILLNDHGNKSVT